MIRQVRAQGVAGIATGVLLLLGCLQCSHKAALPPGPPPEYERAPVPGSGGTNTTGGSSAPASSAAKADAGSVPPTGHDR